MSFDTPLRGAPQVRTKRFWYTAKTSAGAAISDPLKPGFVFCADFWNTAGSAQPGMLAVTRPESANIPHFVGVLTQFAPGMNGAGWVELAFAGGPVLASTKANMTIAQTYLIATNSLWHFTATSSIASLALVASAKGLAQQTLDTSGVSNNPDANAYVYLNPLACIVG